MSAARPAIIRCHQRRHSRIWRAGRRNRQWLNSIGGSGVNGGTINGVTSFANVSLTGYLDNGSAAWSLYSGTIANSFAGLRRQRHHLRHVRRRRRSGSGLPNRRIGRYQSRPRHKQQRRRFRGTGSVAASSVAGGSTPIRSAG